MSIPEYQQRVVDEQDDLKAKIAKLEDFINYSEVFQTLDHVDANLLELQLVHMKEYNKILKKRIERF